MADNLKAECGIFKVMGVLGGKWKLEILWQVANNNGIRFNQLKRNMSKITNVMLSRCLQDLIEHGFIQREDKEMVPPRIEYYATSKVNQLLPILKSLSAFGESEL